jgi:calcineurin-like phosphoesterase family protein
MATYFTSDTHFGHGATLGLMKRPFASVAEMNEALVENWNLVVGPDDEVWHLGDFAIGPKPEALAALFARLNGIKHLVAGNNDGPATKALPWATVRDYAEMTLDGTLLVLCHYPFRSWSGQSKGAWNLHGHSHGAMKPLTRQRDVGVDVWDFRPVGLADLTGRKLSPSRISARR